MPGKPLLKAEGLIRIAPAGVRVRVKFAGQVIAETREALRLQEGSYAPVYYVPRKDARMERLIRTSHTTYCPHKGHATYFSLHDGETARNAVWSYEKPFPEVAAIKDLLAFYPDKVSVEIGGEGEA
jgi:uncharacterized protein (DUF427 family)